jgi:hypothetical protein
MGKLEAWAGMLSPDDLDLAIEGMRAIVVGSMVCPCCVGSWWRQCAVDDVAGPSIKAVDDPGTARRDLPEAVTEFLTTADVPALLKALLYLGLAPADHPPFIPRPVAK